MRVFLFAAWLLVVAAPAGAGPLQGPVEGTVETADGSRAADIVVHLMCLTAGIHGAWPADNVTRIVASGESFRFPWAYRGLAPRGCTLQVYHPHYVVAHRALEERFSQQVGTIRLEPWSSVLDHGPKEAPRSNTARPGPDFRAHLDYVLHHYVPAFPEGEKRKALSRHVPGLHALFKRVLAIGVLDRWLRAGNSDPMKTMRKIEDATAYPGAQSALFDAVSRNDAARVTQLIAAGAYVDAWDGEGRTPLLLAARAGHTESAIALVDGGAAIDGPRHTEPRTALKAALSESRWKTAAALIARGASPRLEGFYLKLLGTALARASYEGDTTSLRRFLEAGIDPDLESSLGQGHTALMSAARANQPDAARLLIGAGANVNARASPNQSPLRIAKSGRFTELVKLLEDAGAKD